MYRHLSETRCGRAGGPLIRTAKAVAVSRSFITNIMKEFFGGFFRDASKPLQVRQFLHKIRNHWRKVLTGIVTDSHLIPQSSIPQSNMLQRGISQRGILQSDISQCNIPQSSTQISEQKNPASGKLAGQSVLD